MKTITAHWKRHRLCLAFLSLNEVCALFAAKNNFISFTHRYYMMNAAYYYSPKADYNLPPIDYCLACFTGLLEATAEWTWIVWELTKSIVSDCLVLWIHFLSLFFPSRLFSKATTTTKIMLFSIYWDVRHHWFGIFSKNLNKRKQIFILNNVQQTVWCFFSIEFGKSGDLSEAV